MRIYIKNIIYLLVFIGYSSANGGSYDDFFSAIRQDNAPQISALLNRGFDPNTPSPDQLDGLYLAIRGGSVRAAAVLIDWPKTRVETRTREDESPLMMAALKGHLELVKKLIARDADVNKTGWTPLHYAATSGHVAIIEVLLENHAYIDAESPNGTTPLMMAASYGTPAAVKVLLEAGADPTLKNQLGLTALDFANRAQRRDAAELIGGAVNPKQMKAK